MSDPLLVMCTCPDEEAAGRLAEALVDEQLAACVNILPRLRSVYRWQGKVESATEVLLLIKTTQGIFARLRDRVLELHSYETPEVIALPIIAGSDDYLAWLIGQVK